MPDAAEDVHMSIAIASWAPPKSKFKAFPTGGSSFETTKTLYTPCIQTVSPDQSDPSWPADRSISNLTDPSLNYPVSPNTLAKNSAQ